VEERRPVFCGDGVVPSIAKKPPEGKGREAGNFLLILRNRGKGKEYKKDGGSKVQSTAN